MAPSSSRPQRHPTLCWLSPSPVSLPSSFCAFLGVTSKHTTQSRSLPRGLLCRSPEPNLRGQSSQKAIHTGQRVRSQRREGGSMCTSGRSKASGQRRLSWAPKKAERRGGEKACNKAPRQACLGGGQSSVSLWVWRRPPWNSPGLIISFDLAKATLIGDTNLSLPGNHQDSEETLNDFPSMWRQMSAGQIVSIPLMHTTGPLHIPAWQPLLSQLRHRPQHHMQAPCSPEFSLEAQEAVDWLGGSQTLLQADLPREQELALVWGSQEGLALVILAIIVVSTHRDPGKRAVVPRPLPCPLQGPSLQRAEGPGGQR